MTPQSRNAKPGRPKASSRLTLEEAAGELFLERGYQETSIADITSRAGVSRNTFFNYFDSKIDVIWVTFDDAVLELPALFARPPGTEDAVDEAIARLFEFVGKYSATDVPLALSQPGQMQLGTELRDSAFIRIGRIANIIEPTLARGVSPDLRAQTMASYLASALVLATIAWATAGSGRQDFASYFSVALEREQ